MWVSVTIRFADGGVKNFVVPLAAEIPAVLDR
jgi:hypothetical protein